MSNADAVQKLENSKAQSNIVELNETESQLLERLLEGDQRSYETLIRSYGPRVLAIGRRYLRSQADVEDCFQDTFIAVYRNIDTFQQRSSLSAWISGIAAKTCLMKLRTLRRHPEEPIDDLLPTFDDTGRRVISTTSKPFMDPGIASDTANTQAYIRNAIDGLPDGYRLVLLLRDIDGYTTEETADILGIKINAVRTRLHRARSALKKLLEPLMQDNCLLVKS